ncbi:MAG: hypothetical protein EOP22_00745 [Hyphomicrobiales bacterium]|nr:MAG: hypothetical protein EOP22_00745 [Hyphomicrobiales bacterium]
MSMRKDGLASQERRVKRRLAKYLVDLLKAQKPTAQVKAHGGYKLRDARSSKIVFGEEGYEFSATLEDIENWLDVEEAKLAERGEI